MNSALLAIISLALFVLATVCYGAGLFIDAPSAPAIPGREGSSLHIAKFGRPLLWVGTSIQFFAIGFWCVQMHRSPFASSFGTLITTAFALALLYALVELRLRLPALGAATLAVVCLVDFWAMVHVGGPVAETPILSQRIVSVHVLSTVFSFGLFSLGGACAALYLIQHRTLKAHKDKSLFRKLPPLATLDTIAYQSVAFALPFLTLGLALGIAYIYRGGVPVAPMWWSDPKTVVSFATWLLYIFYLAARLAGGWRGVRLQYVLLLGLLAALALYLIPGSTHKFL